jgi:RNA polymerase II-associated protein 3
MNTDLRCVLKLQPTNTEAVTELASLLPLPNPNSKTKTKEPSPPVSPFIPSQFPSSSTSRSCPDSASTPIPGSEAAVGGAGNGLDGRQQSKSKLRQSKQPPFARTKADERRLKIVLIPATAAEMALDECDDEVHGAQYHRMHVHGKGKGKGKDKVKTNLSSRNGDGNANANGKGKVNAHSSVIDSAGNSKSKWREMEEIVRSETVVYPGWDRYIVRKVD